MFVFIRVKSKKRTWLANRRDVKENREGFNKRKAGKKAIRISEECIVIPFLFPQHRVYVSFISALHLYGIIEQIPQVMTLASTMHTKIITTKIGTFSVHRIAPSFFDGFVWYKNEGNFLIAEPEKALIDCLYLSAYKRKQFGYFPELHFSSSFSFKKARMWIKRIPNPKIRLYTQKKLDHIAEDQRRTGIS